MSENPKISVLVPAYNVENYVSTCLTSILWQDYHNFELIILNDGSTDGTSEIIEQFRQKDSRVKVITTENHGVATARNELLKHVTGEYIAWIDSDDYVASFYLSTLLKEMQENDCQAVTIDWYSPRFLNGYKFIYSSYDYMSLLLFDGYKSYLCGTMWKKEIFDGIRFPDGSKVEDYYVYPDLIERTEKIRVICSDKLYKYTPNRPGSETQSTGIRIEGLIPREKFALRRYLQFRDRFPKECEVLFSQFVAYANILYLRTMNEKKYKDLHHSVQKDLAGYKKEIQNNPHLSNYKRMLALKIIEDNNPIRHAALLSLKKLHELKGKLKRG